jgi:hypothetical protein
MTISVGNLIVAGGATVDTSEVLSALNKQGLKVWVGTTSQRDALPENVKNDDKITFLTYDSEEDIYLIIDTIISYSKTWSSVKISTELAKKINSSDVYTKTEVMSLINSKVASALKYRGAVATVAALPSSGQENGDSYYVQADGYMYAWSSDYSDWQALGSATDMTNYYTKSEVDALLADLAVKFQYNVMPNADSTTVGKIIQYTGADTNDYKNGYWYKGVDNGDSTYSWVLDDAYYTKTEIDNSGLCAHGDNAPFLENSTITNYLTGLDAKYKFATFTVDRANTTVSDRVNSTQWFSYYCYRQNTSWRVIATDSGTGKELYTTDISAGNPVTWSKLATTDDVLDNNYNGSFMTATVAWFKTGALFAYPTAGGFWSSTFLLSDRDGAWTGILKVADNGAGSVTATIVSLGANPRGGEEFYFDETSYCLYFCGSWDRITITQLTGKKVDLSITSTTQEEAKQNTKIVPTVLATTDNLIRVTESEYQLQVGGDNYAWFDLGTSPGTGNSQAYLFYEITYGRVDGLQSKILVSCGGTMADGNYFKIINLNNAQTSAAEQFKLDSNKHLWLGMQSYCDAHVKVYGRWTGMGSKTTVEPTGTNLPIYKLVASNDIFLVGDRRSTIGWADLTSDVNVDGSSNYANNIGRIDGRNAMILVSNPTPNYQWPVTNSGDKNIFLDFGSYVQFFVDTVNNSLYVRSRDSVDMGNWGAIATQSMLPEYKAMTTGDADELRSLANDKLYSLKVSNPFNVVDDEGASYQIPATAEAIFYKHSGDLTVQFHSYYGTSGIWEVFYNSNGQTRGKKLV